MTLVSAFHVLSVAFFMGLLAAAPVGPVNMMAIRRGIAGGWRHTVACAIGSIAADLTLFSLALLGGHYLVPGLSRPAVQEVLEAIAAIALLPPGVYFLALAVRDPRRAYRMARNSARGPVPAHLTGFLASHLTGRLAGDAAEGAALTLFNPLTMLFWVGVTSSWLPFAVSVLGPTAPEWGFLMVAAGLIAWFAGLTVAVRAIPRRIGPIFFRLANGILGLILLGFAVFCAILVYRHFPH
jgi:threonine/homoserine/homoserine lactone efflux protein